MGFNRSLRGILQSGFKKICPDCLLFQRKSVFLHCLHAESGLKTAGKSRKEVSLRCLLDTIYGKGVYHALCS